MYIAKPHVVQTPTLFSWSIEPAEIQWLSNVVSVNIQRALLLSGEVSFPPGDQTRPPGDQDRDL